MVEKVAQEWLKDNHENNKSNVKEIKINGRRDNTELKGEIEFKDYVNLEVVELVVTKGLIKVTFKNCLAIKEISVYGNEITEIDGLDGLTELRELKCNDNKLTKIDVSKNTKLVVFRYHANPLLKGENIKGLGNLTNIVRITGGVDANDGIALNLTLISKELLDKIAKELDINVQGKSIEEIKKLIEEKGKIFRENKQKLDNTTTGLPGLLDGAEKVDDNELKKINELIGKGKGYDQLKNDNQNLVEKDKISQDKIKGLEDANKDVAAAIDRLGVVDLKTPTLNAKLGDGTKLSDILPPSTLKDLLEKIKKLEDALKNSGMNPQDNDLQQQIEKLKNDSKRLEAAEKIIKQEEGEKY
jgi:hypothetical protein